MCSHFFGHCYKVNIVDPNPNEGYGSGSRRLKNAENFQRRSLENFSYQLNFLCKFKKKNFKIYTGTFRPIWSSLDPVDPHSRIKLHFLLFSYGCRSWEWYPVPVRHAGRGQAGLCRGGQPPCSGSQAGYSSSRTTEILSTRSGE